MHLLDIEDEVNCVLLACPTAMPELVSREGLTLLQERCGSKFGCMAEDLGSYFDQLVRLPVSRDGRKVT